MFYTFLQKQYRMENITKEQLYSYVPKFISEEEYQKIVLELSAK